MENKESFSYTYSAKDREEIKRIREKYVPKEQDKMEQLRRLDRSASKKGTSAALIIGIAGTLLFGTGMCCCMEWTDLFVPGIIIGVIGIAAISAAYPLYNYVTKKEREKIAPQIIRITDELMK